VAFTAEQALHVVWTEQVGEDYGMYHAYSLDNGLSWYAMQPIADASGYAVSLASSPAGYLRAAWQSKTAGDDNTMRIYTAAYDGDLWTQPMVTSLGLDGDGRSPELGVDSAGRAHLVWEQDTYGGASSIYYAQDSAGAWTAPFLLSSAGEEAQYPCLTVGPMADIHIAWNNGHALLHRRYSQGRWEPPEPVATGQAGIRQAALAAGSDGVIYAAWSARGDTGVWNVYLSQRSPYEQPTPAASSTTTATPGALNTPTRPAASHSLLPTFLLSHRFTPPVPNPPSARALALPQAEPTWSAPTNISSSAKDSRNVALTMGLDGTLYAVWEERNYVGSTTILSYSRLLNGSWTEPKVFLAGEEPSLATSPDGGVHLVFANEFRGNYDIYYTTWITDNWSGAVNVSSTTGRSLQPALAVRSDNRPVVAWSETLDGQTSIYYARQDNGFWTTYPVDASSDGQAPDVAVERGDRTWVTWQALENGVSCIYATDVVGDSWGDVQELSYGSDADSTRVDMVGKSSLGAFVVWQGAKTTGSQIYYTHNVRLANWWEEPVSLSAELGSASGAAMAVTEGGDIHLVWSEGTNLRYRRGNANGGTWSTTTTIASQAQGFGPAAVLGSDTMTHAAWDRAVSGDQHDIYYSAAGAPTPTITPSPTPSRTPTPTRTLTPSPTSSPLPYRLGMPLVIKS